MGLRDHDAAEVIQQVYAKVLSHIDDFDHHGPGTTFRGWLRTITENCVSEFYRQQNRLEELTPQAANAIHAPISVEEARADLAGLFTRALQVLEAEEEMPKGPREAFLAHFFDQKTYAEIAEETGLSVGAVRNRVNRAAAKLRQILAPEFPNLANAGDSSNTSVE
jgi:RNA polymerase sigma-70 factor (ECF subfamily)